MSYGMRLLTAERRPQNILSLNRSILDRISVPYLGWQRSTRPILEFSCCHQGTEGNYVDGCGPRLGLTFPERMSINSFDDSRNRTRHAISRSTDVTAMGNPSHSCRYFRRARTA